MMMAAIAHHQTSIYCVDSPHAKTSSMDQYYFHIVAFELILLSIEHSLKLTLLLENSINPPTHKVHTLYNKVIKCTSDRGKLQLKVVTGVNHYASSAALPFVEENSILECLKKHDSSYVNFRYFGVDKKARSVSDWEITAYEAKILYCLAATLLDINVDMLRKHGMGIPQSVRSAYEANTAENLRELMQLMTERLMG